MNPDAIRLTDEEIGDNLVLADEAQYPCSDGSAVYTIAVDQLLQAAVRKVAEWLEQDCEEHRHGLFHRRECPECLQFLRQVAGLED